MTYRYIIHIFTILRQKCVFTIRTTYSISVYYYAQYIIRIYTHRRKLYRAVSGSNSLPSFPIEHPVRVPALHLQYYIIFTVGRKKSKKKFVHTACILSFETLNASCLIGNIMTRVVSFRWRGVHKCARFSSSIAAAYGTTIFRKPYHPPIRIYYYTEQMIDCCR